MRLEQFHEAWGVRPVPAPSVREVYRNSGYWRDRTIAEDLDDVAARMPDKVAVVDNRHGSMTYKELEKAARHSESLLGGLGIGYGDIVLLVLPNWQHVSAYLVAVSRLRAVPVMVPTTWRERELSDILSLTNAKAIIAPATFRQRDYRDLALELQACHSSVETVVAIRGPLQEAPTTYRRDASGGVVEKCADVHGREGQEEAPLAALMFTSGSSGEAKGVMHSTNTLGAMNTTVAPCLGLTQEDVIFMGASVAYSAGLVHGVRLALSLGATLVLQEYWEPEEAVELMAAHGATFTLTTPTLLRDLLAARGLRARRSGLALRIMMCGGGFVSEELLTSAYEVLPKTFTTSLWGMTEGLGTACRSGTPRAKLQTTDGEPFLGTELRIISDPEGAVDPNESGEILMRGPQLFRGYFKRPGYTDEAFTEDGWFRTGDVGRLDGDGFLKVLGRSKELIIRGGVNISPAEIEAQLLTDRRVAQCAVVGIPDDRLGERVCACVVPASPEAGLTLTDVRAVIEAAGLSRQKWPEELVLLDDLPMTAGGKVQRGRIQEFVPDLVRERDRPRG